MRVVEHDVLPFVYGHVEVGNPADGVADDVQVAATMVVRLASEERAVDVAQVVEYSAAAAVSILLQN